MTRSFFLLACALLAPVTPALAQTAPAAAAPQPAQDLAEFPYLGAPDGYALRNQTRLEFEQKYLFPGGRLEIVEGPYFHADIFVDGGVWNETLLLSRFDRQIAALGGKRMFDGSMPAAARTMIQENAPRFVKDLYDPWPYRFRQYLIQRPDKTIWVEIGYGYNAEMLDLTVIEKEPQAD